MNLDLTTQPGVPILLGRIGLSRHMRPNPAPLDTQKVSYGTSEKVILALIADTWKAALLQARVLLCEDVKATVAHMTMPFYEPGDKSYHPVMAKKKMERPKSYIVLLGS